MNARQKIKDWLEALAAALPNDHPLFGLAINLDTAQMAGANSDKHCGVTLGHSRARKLRNANGELVDKNAEQEVIVYAHVEGKDKKERTEQYQQVERIIAWLEEQFELDPGANGALCPNALLGEWRTPGRGDALDSQPYVLSISPLSYEEP